MDARGTRFPKSGVLGSCELPSLCARRQNPDSLQDQYVLFTLNSSLRHLFCKCWEIVLLVQVVIRYAFAYCFNINKYSHFLYKLPFNNI